MPITLGGIDLTPPPYALAAVERWWHVHRIQEFDHPAYHVAGIDHLPIPYPPSQEPLRIGVLHWPTGASRWATCHLLCTGDQLLRLQRLSASVLDLVISDGTRSVTAPMYRLAARPVSQRGDGRELYLLTLVDDRYWWWFAGDTPAPDAPADWDELITDLFDAVGVTPTVATVHADYGTPDAARWDVGTQPVPLLIDAVAKTVGLRVVRTLAGVVSCVDYATAAASDDEQWEVYRYECLAGGRAATAEVARNAPASVSTVFPGAEPATETDTLAALAPAEYDGETGVADKVGAIAADMPAPADAGDRADYATRAATDYYLWQLSRTDATFRGVRPWTPTGLEDCCEWVCGADEILTRVLRSRLFDPNSYSVDPALTVQGDAGTPSYSPIDTLRFGAAFTITNPATGRANIEVTAESLAGVITTSLSSCAWTVWFKTTQCLTVELVAAIGRCAGATINTDYPYLSHDTGVWVSDDPDVLTHDTGTGPVTFTPGVAPAATADGVSGQYLGCDGSGRALFGFASGTLCDDAADPDCVSWIVLAFSCTCCSIEGWAGEGWYCIRDAGTEDACYPAELLEADRCDDTIEICSGPYADEAAALEVCPQGTIDTACCPDDLMFEVLNWEITDITGACSCISSTTGTVTYDAGLGVGIDGAWGTVAFDCLIGDCEENASYILECVEGVWQFNGGALTVVSCNPFEIYFTKTIGGGSYKITFTS